MLISINSYNLKIYAFLILLIFICLLLIFIINNENQTEEFQDIISVKDENNKNARKKLDINSNEENINEGDKGDKGDKGDTGAKGDKGDKGGQGKIGKKGKNALPIPPIKFIDKESREILGKFPEENYPSIEQQAKDGIQEIIIPIPRGKDGDKGDIGKTGQKGARGLQGNSSLCVGKGDSGKQGERGPQGAIGEKGPQGPSGPPGTAGPVAQTGLPGIPGMKGAPAPQVAPPKDGERGQQGPQGPQGPAGPLDIKSIPRNKRKEHRNHFWGYLPFIKIQDVTAPERGGSRDVWVHTWANNALLYCTWNNWGDKNDPNHQWAKPAIFLKKGNTFKRLGQHPSPGHGWDFPQTRDGGSVKFWIHWVPTGTKGTVVGLWWDD